MKQNDPNPIMAPDEDPQPLSAIVRNMDIKIRAGDLADFKPIATGIGELDAALGGGLRQGQLVMLSGPAGVGKTSLMLQIARNIAANNGLSIFVCYEHETEYLAQRLISMESVAGNPDPSPAQGLRLRDIEEIVTRHARSKPSASFADAMSSDPRGARAMSHIARYSENLLLLKGSSYKTTVDALSGLVWQARKKDGNSSRPTVLFVDYLQKIASETSHVNEGARNTEEIEGLKELALEQKVVVVAIVAAEVEGLKAQRMRFQHILASASIAYEADIAILMNEKFDIVDRRHIEFNRYNADQFHQYVILSIEKNRSGSDLVDIELRKQLQFCHFRPDARRVVEQLISGRQRE